VNGSSPKMNAETRSSSRAARTISTRASAASRSVPRMRTRSARAGAARRRRERVTAVLIEDSRCRGAPLGLENEETYPAGNGSSLLRKAGRFISFTQEASRPNGVPLATKSLISLA
jgi:hypothetical protein